MHSRLLFPSLSLLCLLLTSAVNGQQKQIPSVETPAVESISFTSEENFVKWLAKVQFLHKDETSIYYHNGFRFKVKPKGQMFRTKAALNHKEGTITWIAKAPDKTEKITTLFITNAAEAELKRKGEKSVVLPVRSR